MTPSGCPACSSTAQPSFVEEHFDRIGAKTYRLSLCPDCGVVFSEPRQMVGADWYAKSAPLRGRERRPAPEEDWRFRQFFSDELPPGRLLDVHAMEFSDFIASRRAGEFDVATLFDVLEHTPEPGWFLGRVASLLKPGGHIVVTLPNASRPLPWGREENDYPPHHFTRWTPQAMKGFLERHGFEVVRQESDALQLSYLSDHFFFYRLMPGVLALARRALFGRGAAEGSTISELYERSGTSRPGLLSDKMTRQRIIDAARAAFEVVSAPVALILRTYYRLSRRHGGDYLYTLARLRPDGAPA